jgi:hypothetical protein
MRAQARLRAGVAAIMIQALTGRRSTAMLASRLRRLAAAAVAALVATPLSALAQPGGDNVVLAVPNVALSFAPGYLAEDLGLFAKQGLNVKSVVITGIGSANAVISGSADFAQISGATLTRAAARGQRLLGLASTLIRPAVLLVLRKEIAAAAGFDPKAPLVERARLMHGRTIGVDSINSVIHAYVLLLARAPATVPTTSALRRWPRTACWRRSRPGRSTASPCRCRGRCSRCSKATRW